MPDPVSHRYLLLSPSILSIVTTTVSFIIITTTIVRMSTASIILYSLGARELDGAAGRPPCLLS